MKKYKILIDTDPGDDIDDVLALAYVLYRNCFELIGVTTVFKQTDKRARLVKKLCALKGAAVPVYYGYGLPMTGHIPESQPINQYSARLDGDEFAPDNRTGEEDAVDFIIDACNRYGGELIVIGIGPLTNLARAIVKDPVALSRVKATVIMGGDFGGGPPEWNIFCDPVGAQTVFGQAKALTAVGVEITGRTRLTQAQTAVLENAAQTGFFEYVGELVRMWRQAHGGALPVLHDVLAVCCINTDVCAFAEGKFAVDTDSRPGLLLAGRGQSVRYATGLDKEAFIREFMSVWQQ